MRRTIFCAAIGFLLVAGSLVAAQRQAAPTPEYWGRILKMDPARGILTLRASDGTNVVEENFQVRGNTRFYTFNNMVIIEGLRNTNFRPGADVYFRLFPGSNRSLSELRLAPPGR